MAWNKTEIISQCIGVKDESDQDRENRIRQFEDFFNVSGMGTPDDLVEFREATARLPGTARALERHLARPSQVGRGQTR